MPKFNLKRLSSLSIAVSLVVTLNGCHNSNNNESSTYKNNTSISTTIKSIYKSIPIDSIAESIKTSLENIKISEIPNENINEIEPSLPSPGNTLESPLIASELTKMENGEPFNFPYVTGQQEMGIASVFDLVGPLFKQIELDGQKYLVDAKDESKVFLKGYDWLGYPYYLFGYDKENGGIDPKSEYSGWVIPAYYYVDKDDQDMYDIYNEITPKYTYNLYDFETFKPLIIDAVPADDTFYTYSDCFGIPGPVLSMYIPEYDPKNGGQDENNKSAGYAMKINKGNKNYLVDVNDFKTVLISGYSNIEPDEYITQICTKDGNWTSLNSKDINPTKSNILMRKLKP